MKQSEFEPIYCTYYSQIYAFVRKRISHPQDSEELTSEIFLRAYQSIERYDSRKASIATWLYVIASNALKNYYRDKKIVLPLEQAESLPDQQSTLEEAVLLEEQRNALLHALELLSPRGRSILIMRFYQQKSGSEIAKLLGITEVNVRTTQKRSLDKLKKYIQLQEELK